MKGIFIILVSIATATALSLDSPREPKVLIYEVSERDGGAPLVKQLKLPRNAKLGLEELTELYQQKPRYNKNKRLDQNRNVLNKNDLNRLDLNNKDQYTLSEILKQVLDSDSYDAKFDKRVRFNHQEYVPETESLLEQALKPQKRNRKSERKNILQRIKGLVSRLQDLDNEEESSDAEASIGYLEAVNSLLDDTGLLGQRKLKKLE